MKFIRLLRIILALISITALTVAFVDITGVATVKASFLPRLQLVPALLAANVVVVAALLLLTFAVGRVYCSVICPLGIYQDVVGRLRQIFSPRKRRRAGIYGHKEASSRVRFAFLACFVVLMILGCTSVIATSFAGLLDPYSAYGRIAGQFFVPVWRTATDTIADAAARHGVYIVDGYAPSTAFNVVVAAIALVTIVVVTAMAWTGGRDYCNKICPVGTLLGLISRYSLFGITIDTSRCNGCGACSRHCKAGCIDPKAHAVDTSRCVVCLDCPGACRQGAIGFGRRHKAAPEAKPIDQTRRAFVVGITLASGAVAASAADGGLAPIKRKKRVATAAPSVPAGAISVAHLRSHCTACQLCISACPNGVLKPSTSLDSLMQPIMTFTDGFCRPDCTACADICPAGAIVPVDTATKSTIRTGTARVDALICISAAYGQHCGNCARRCPSGAITMVPTERGTLRPAVDESRCTGCGACEYHCPSGRAGHITASTAAIHVEGATVHTTI